MTTEQKLEAAIAALEQLATATDTECDFDAFDARELARAVLAQIRTTEEDGDVCVVN